MGWDELERMLAVYYRGQGYVVEHCGTVASGTRFDGGIDLKLRKDDAYIIVQCKHWNAKQVPHNPVHELIGVMMTQGATGAIFVTSGEYTRAAIEAAAKQGHVQLIDGDDLRAMLGPLPEPVAQGLTEVGVVSGGGSHPMLGRVVAATGERLLAAEEDRIRGGRPARRLGSALGAGLLLIVVKVAIALAVFWILSSSIKDALKGLQPAVAPAQANTAVRLPAPSGESPRLLENPGAVDGSEATQSVQAAPAYQPPTPEEIRESKRQADEAMRILEANTPEM